MRRGPTRAIFPFSSLPPLSFPLPHYITFLPDSPRQPLYFFSSILRNKRRQNRGHLLSLEFFKVAASYDSKYGFNFPRFELFQLVNSLEVRIVWNFYLWEFSWFCEGKFDYRAIGVTPFPNQLYFLYFRHSDKLHAISYNNQFLIFQQRYFTF